MNTETTRPRIPRAHRGTVAANRMAARTHPRRPVAVLAQSGGDAENLHGMLVESGRVEVSTVFESAAEALDGLSRMEPDVLVIDLDLPGAGALQLHPTVASGRVAAVLVARGGDAVERALKLTAANYLMKPVQRGQLSRALARAVDEADGPGGDGTHAEPREDYLEWLLVSSRGEALTLRTADVHWIGAEDNYLRLHVGTRSYLIRETIARLERRLDPRRFVRIHRSTIVNLEHVRSVKPWGARDAVIVMESGEELRISRRYNRQLGTTVGDYR